MGFEIYIDTNTDFAAPNVYADAAKTQPLPAVLNLVEGFRSYVDVYFLGNRAPAKEAGVAFYLRPRKTRENAVQTDAGEYSLETFTIDGETVEVPRWRISLLADTSVLSMALRNRESEQFLGGLVAYDSIAETPTRFEWQFPVLVHATAIGTGEKPPVSVDAIEAHNEDEAAHPYLLAKIAAVSAGVETDFEELTEKLTAETAARTAADSELAESIAKEATARESADSETRVSLSEEASARESADATLSKSITDETTARTAAVSALESSLNDETARAKGAESEITAQIEAGTATLEESIAAVKKTAEMGLSCAIAADAVADCAERGVIEVRLALSEEITRATGAESTLATSIANEAAARSEESSKIRAALSEEVQTRINYDGVIRSEISNTASAIRSEISNTASAIRSETADAITAEKTARTATDSEIRSEIADVSEGFTVELSTVCANLLAETTARTAADSALVSCISSEITRAKAAEATKAPLTGAVFKAPFGIVNTDGTDVFSVREGLFALFNNGGYAQFYAGSYAQFYDGSYAQFYDGSYAQFYAGSYAQFYAGSRAQFKAGSYAQFYAGSYAQFYAGSRAQFKAGSCIYAGCGGGGELYVHFHDSGAHCTYWAGSFAFDTCKKEGTENLAHLVCRIAQLEEKIAALSS